MVLSSKIMEEFRRTMFNRLIPNLKAIGLLSDRIKPRYQTLGLLQFENGLSADRITLTDLLA